MLQYIARPKCVKYFVNWSAKLVLPLPLLPNINHEPDGDGVPKHVFQVPVNAIVSCFVVIILVLVINIF
jgi:hypothetical protein